MINIFWQWGWLRLGYLLFGAMLNRKSRWVSFLFPICPGISNKTLLASSVYSKFDIVYNGLIAARRRENHCRLIWVQNEFKIKIEHDNYIHCQRSLTSYFVVVGTVEDCLQRQEWKTIWRKSLRKEFLLDLSGTSFSYLYTRPSQTTHRPFSISRGTGTRLPTPGWTWLTSHWPLSLPRMLPNN